MKGGQKFPNSVSLNEQQPSVSLNEREHIKRYIKLNYRRRRIGEAFYRNIAHAYASLFAQGKKSSMPI